MSDCEQRSSNDLGSDVFRKNYTMIFQEGQKKTHFPKKKSAREEYEEYLREKNKNDRSRIVSSIFGGDSSYYMYKQRRGEGVR